MSRAQKIARFDLVVALTGLSLSVASVGVLYFVVGLPLHRAVAGFGFIGICGLAGFSPLLYKKESGSVSFDERDVAIRKKASLRAYTIFWVLFVLAVMIPFAVLGPDGQVSVKYLAGMVFGGMLTVILVQSIVTLEEYGWRTKGNE